MNNLNSNHAKRLYSIPEGKAILRYIIDNDCTTLIGGIKLWQKMEADEVCPGRTWQSMKNHFKRTIIADIKGAAHATKHSLEIWPHYEITPAELRMLKHEWKFQINSFVKPHIKSIMQKRLSPPKKILSAKDKPDMTWRNSIISSSDEEESSRNESEIGKKNNEKTPATASKSEGLIAILNISTQPESSRTKNPSVDKLVEKTQPNQATLNTRHTEENFSSQYQGAKGKSKRFRKVVHILDDDSSNDENQIDQNKRCQESNQTCTRNERLEEQMEMKKAEDISGGDARKIGLSAEDQPDLTWLNPIISSSDDEEDSRNESEIGKKNNKKIPPTASTPKGLITILNITKIPSTQPELSRTEKPSVDRLVKRTQPDQAASNTQHTEEIPPSQYQGAKEKFKRSRKVTTILSDDDSSNDENQIDQNEKCHELNKTCAINERLEEQIKMKKVEKNGDASNIGPMSPRIPEKLGWVGKKSNKSSRPHGKNVNFTVSKKERYLSEIEALKKLREQNVYSPDIMTSDDDDVYIGKSNPATPEQSHTGTIVRGLKKSKHVKLKRIDPRELTKSQKEHMKAARDFKNSRLKINPFAIGAQHFSKLKDVEIRPLWPS